MSIHKEITLRVFGETESEVDNIINTLKLILSNPHIGIYKVEDTKFDWDATAEVAVTPDTELWEIADNLYSKLMYDTSRFNDWEYKFIQSTYQLSMDKRNYSKKQREWLKKLQEKYL